MTSAQKVIKMAAVAFAIFLIVTIISAILSGIYALLTVTGVVKNNENSTKLGDMTVIAEDIYDVSILSIETKGTNLKIETGSKFEVKSNNSNIKVIENNGNVVVKENSIMKWLGNTKIDSELIIVIPENTEEFEEVSIEAGAGEIKIDSLNTKELSFNLGAGKVTLDNLKVLNDAKIDGGAGEIIIKNCDLNNLDMDLGIGKTTIEGEISGKSKIDTGVGELDLKLNSNLTKYKFELEKGIGQITVDGDKVPNDCTIGNGTNKIEINGGVGAINISTNKIKTF